MALCMQARVACTTRCPVAAGGGPQKLDSNFVECEFVGPDPGIFFLSRGTCSAAAGGTSVICEYMGKRLDTDLGLVFAVRFAELVLNVFFFLFDDSNDAITRTHTQRRFHSRKDKKSLLVARLTAW